jgi:anaerobic magnesium-protoporphyrin IX monomethyl ester cyclase
MNILLINPKSTNAFEAFGFVFPPLGLLYIAATAERAGHRIAIEDFCVSGNKPSEFDYSGYDVVGITTDTRRFNAALNIARRAKSQGCTVVMGGPHPGFAEDEILGGGAVDYIIRGEGEYIFPALLDAVERGSDVSSVPGISYLADGRIARTPTPDLIDDLDALPMPARHLVDMDLYKRKGLKYGGKRPVAVISSSRGCPYNCSFCITPQMYGRRWRSRSAQSVVAEMEEVYLKYGYRAFAFCDDNFTVSPQRVKEICELILEKGLDFWWWCLSTPALLLKNEDMVSLMSKAGVKTVYIGVESANPATLKEFNKGITQDIVFRAVDLLRRNGIEAFGSFILGGTQDTLSTTLATIRHAKMLDTAVAQFTILTPYPGTALFKEMEPALRHKRWHLYDGVHLVFRHKNISFVLMELLLIFAYASFYARGLKSIRNFFKAFKNNTPFFKKVTGKAN